MGTLHEDQYTFVIICSSFLHKMQNISDKTCRENQNTFFTGSIFFFENRAVCDIMKKNIVKPGRKHGACALHAR